MIAASSAPDASALNSSGTMGKFIEVDFSKKRRAPVHEPACPECLHLLKSHTKRGCASMKWDGKVHVRCDCKERRE